MKRQPARALIGATLALVIALPVGAASTDEATDYGRNRYRTHYSPVDLEYPLAGARAAWEVPLGLSRSQPLVIQRDFNGDGQVESRIFHSAGDRLWGLNGQIDPPPRGADQDAESYRQQLRAQGFILWDRPALHVCSSDLTARDENLGGQCEAFNGWRQNHPLPARPFASSQPAYRKGSSPNDDVIYVGFGYPASVAAINARTGQILGAVILDFKNDRGIVGAPLTFPGDVVVVGTTTGDAFIIRGLTNGQPSTRTLRIGGRISSSPVPVGETGFIMATDARWTPSIGSHGYMMAYQLPSPGGGVKEFAARWPSAVVTPSGIPGESAVDERAVYFADKRGRLYALRVDNGEMLWCRQYPSFGPCSSDGDDQPAFINNGPGVDPYKVYFVYRNDEGPNQGTGRVVALDKATGDLVWQQRMDAPGNTAPVPTDHLVLVGDASGWIRAYDKETGAPVNQGGYPLKLSDNPYQSGTQGEHWWEPVGGTATQMTVVNGLILFGVNSTTDEQTLLRAFKLYQLLDLTVASITVPTTAETLGFPIETVVVCHGCVQSVTTSVGLQVDGFNLPRQAAMFSPENGYRVVHTWQSGPVPSDSTVTVTATVDPENDIAEKDETNNSKEATVKIPSRSDTSGQEDGIGSSLTN